MIHLVLMVWEDEVRTLHPGYDAVAPETAAHAIGAYPWSVYIEEGGG